MTDEEFNESLRTLPTDGFVRFSIKAKDTPENEAVHGAFKEFAKVECDDNYTMALRKLLEYYQGDHKHEMIWDKVVSLEKRLNEIETAIHKAVEGVDSDTF